MDNRLKILFLIPLLYFTQACQVLLPPMRVEAALPAPTTFIAPTTSVEPTAFVVLSPTPTQEPAPTPLPPTPLPTLEPAFIPPTETSAPEQIVEQALVLTPTVRPTASPVQLSVFEELWSTVKSDYLYRDFNGVPWDFVHEVYRYKIEAGLTNEEFYALMEEMIALLGDNHSTFLSPDIAGEHQAEFSGQTEYVGIGVMTEPVPEKKRVSIVAVFPDSPASEAGILPHDSILEVDGQPLVDDAGRVKSLLKGAEGSASVITVQTPGQEPRMVYIVRRKIAAAPPMPYHVLLTPQGKRVGYIMISTFMDEDTGPKVAAALKDMSAGGALDGLIIDDRMNSGGALISMADTLSLFTDGLVGYVTVNNETFPLGVDGRNVAGSQKLPLVVLIDHPTASAGEIFAGILKDAGRAYLIGETTYGNVEMLSLFDFEDGSSALIAMAKFRPANHPGEDWEYTGIVPDMSVITVWDEITQETDPLIRYGLYYFDRN